MDLTNVAFTCAEHIALRVRSLVSVRKSLALIIVCFNFTSSRCWIIIPKSTETTSSIIPVYT